MSYTDESARPEMSSEEHASWRAWIADPTPCPNPVCSIRAGRGGHFMAEWRQCVEIERLRTLVADAREFFVRGDYETTLRGQWRAWMEETDGIDPRASQPRDRPIGQGGYPHGSVMFSHGIGAEWHSNGTVTVLTNPDDGDRCKRILRLTAAAAEDLAEALTRCARWARGHERPVEGWLASHD